MASLWNLFYFVSLRYLKLAKWWNSSFWTCALFFLIFSLLLVFDFFMYLLFSFFFAHLFFQIHITFVLSCYCSFFSCYSFFSFSSFTFQVLCFSWILFFFFKRVQWCNQTRRSYGGSWEEFSFLFNGEVFLNKRVLVILFLREEGCWDLMEDGPLNQIIWRNGPTAKIEHSEFRSVHGIPRSPRKSGRENKTGNSP